MPPLLDPKQALERVRTVTVYVLENLRKPGLVPCEPDLPILIEEDDDAPISIGLEEGEAQRRKSWELKRPHRVNVPMCTYRTGTVHDGRHAMEASSKMIKDLECRVEAEGEQGEGVYTSVHAALSEAFAIASGRPTVTNYHGSFSQRRAQTACSTSSDDINQGTNRGNFSFTYLLKYITTFLHAD